MRCPSAVLTCFSSPLLVKICVACVDEEAITCNASGSLTCSYDAILLTDVNKSGPDSRKCVSSCIDDNFYAPTASTCTNCPAGQYYGRYTNYKGCLDCSTVDPAYKTCSMSYYYGGISATSCKSGSIDYSKYPYKCVESCPTPYYVDTVNSKLPELLATSCEISLTLSPFSHLRRQRHQDLSALRNVLGRRER